MLKLKNIYKDEDDDDDDMIFSSVNDKFELRVNTACLRKRAVWYVNTAIEERKKESNSRHEYFS